MNNQRRKELTKIVEEISSAADSLEILMCEEEEAYDAMPDSLKETEKCENMSENASDLSEAIDDLNSALETIQQVIER